MTERGATTTIKLDSPLSASRMIIKPVVFSAPYATAAVVYTLPGYLAAFAEVARSESKKNRNAAKTPSGSIFPHTSTLLVTYLFGIRNVILHQRPVKLLDEAAWLNNSSPVHSCNKKHNKRRDSQHSPSKP